MYYVIVMVIYVLTFCPCGKPGFGIGIIKLSPGKEAPNTQNAFGTGARAEDEEWEEEIPLEHDCELSFD
jgi:hypothetical protein